MIENGRICQDNGSVDGHPFGILDGARKNQKLATEVVQSGRKLVSIRIPSILEISGSISRISSFFFFPNIRLLEIIQRNSYTLREEYRFVKKNISPRYFISRNKENNSNSIITRYAIFRVAACNNQRSRLVPRAPLPPLLPPPLRIEEIKG